MQQAGQRRIRMKKKFQEFIRRGRGVTKRQVQKSLIILRRTNLPGQKGVGLYDILKFFISSLRDRKFTLMASAMSYHFFFSLFPSLILIFTFVPQIPITNLQDYIMFFLSQVMPQEGFQFIKEVVEESLSKRPVGLISLNIFFTLFGASRGIIAMMKAFTKNDELFKRRSLFELYGTAMFVFIILGIFFLSSIGVLILGEHLISQAHVFLGKTTTFYTLKLLNYLIALFMLFFSISILYYITPATHQRWKFFSPGSITAGTLILLAILGFGSFVNHFPNFNKIYGSLGAITITMLWFYILSILLLIGFELNAAIDFAQHHKRRFRVSQKSA